MLTNVAASLSGLVSRLAGWHEQHSRVAEQALQENLTRLPWVMLGLQPLFGAGLLLAWRGSESADIVNPMGALFSRWVGWIDLGMMVWLGLLLVLMLVRHRVGHINLLTRRLPIILAFNFVAFGVTLSLLSQWGLPSATMYVLACVFVGTLLLIRPSQIALVYGSSYLAFYVGLGLTATSWQVMVVLRFHGFIAMALGLCLSMVLWRRHTVTELLRRQVQAQSHALEVQNAELERQKNLLEQMALHDSLTGVLNRRAFKSQAAIALQRARRDDTGIAAVMMDLDFFKRVNDQYGHPAGDEVIKHMADVLRDSVRDTDLVARVGGEEFILLLPGSNAAAAYVVAEKIRLRVLARPVALASGASLVVTVSAGVAEQRAGQITSVEALYAAADQALYKAKQCGRNQVVLSSSCN